jgi:pimeloyl-ACP methyl ester carboxylesterase
VEQLFHRGVVFAYEEMGRGAPHVVLIHDLGADHSSLRALLDHFQRQHRTIAVDLPGHGQSGRREEPFSVSSLADDLAWLCYAMGLYRPLLVGHGFGGVIAIQMAAQHPDLAGGVVVVEAGGSNPAAPFPGSAALQVPVLCIASSVPTGQMAPVIDDFLLTRVTTR